MKYSGDFALFTGLPEAPLDMPKQKLERRRSLIDVIRATLWPFAGR